jgi:protein TonB
MEECKTINKNYFSYLSFLIIISTLFLLSSCHNIRYTTTKYDVQKDLVDNLNDFKTDTNFVKVERLNDTLMIQKTYSKTGILVSQEKFKKYTYIFKYSQRYSGDMHYFGESRFWHLNGNLKTIVNFDNDEYIDGELITYYENGQIRRHDFVKHGVLEHGKCYDIKGNEIEHTPYFIMPYCSMERIEHELIYPEEMRMADIEEDVQVCILFDTLGKPIKIKYDTDNSIYFVNEVIRLITIDKLFEPGKIDGYPVFDYIILPVRFRLK